MSKTVIVVFEANLSAPFILTLIENDCGFQFYRPPYLVGFHLVRQQLREVLEVLMDTLIHRIGQTKIMFMSNIHFKFLILVLTKHSKLSKWPCITFERRKKIDLKIFLVI